MAQLIYTITMSDGKLLTIEANSAAEACNKALWQHRGCTVKDCFHGSKEPYITSNVKMPAGWISYDVPKHEPVAADAVKPGRGRAKDATEPMFNEEEIAAESRIALARDDLR